MDLSFARETSPRATALPTRLAVLLVGVATRQAASPTARMLAVFAPVAGARDPLAPGTGAFHAATAAALTRWQAL